MITNFINRTELVIKSGEKELNAGRKSFMRNNLDLHLKRE